MKPTKIICILLTVIVIFSFTGCSADSTVTEDSASSTIITDSPDSLNIESTASATDLETSPPADETSSAAAGKTYKIGESVTSGNLVFTINSVREAAEADITYPPNDGNIYYIVNVSVENKGKETEQLSTLTMFQLTDSDKDEIGEQLVSVTGGKVLATGDLAAGAKNTGDIAYEMPASAKDLKMLVSSDIFSNDPFTFELDR